MYCRMLLYNLAIFQMAACSPASTSIERGQTTVVFFTSDSVVLDSSAQIIIRQVAARASLLPSLQITGFAAKGMGTDGDEAMLAQARAQTVADSLVVAGVAKAHLHIQSGGPVNFRFMPTEARRVEIAVGS